jgi:TM2 domain-containing membrane protein YozV
MLGGMTEPHFSGSEGGNSYPPPPQQPGYPAPGQQPGYPPPGQQYSPPPGAYPPPYGQYPSAYADPVAPWGRHPMTGEPLSEKSKVVAGLLQLLGLFGLVGIGRIYLGYTGLGVAQLVVGLITCGLGAVIWGIVDAVLILTDRVRDPEGRPLRDGT